MSAIHEAGGQVGDLRAKVLHWDVMLCQWGNKPFLIQLTANANELTATLMSFFNFSFGPTSCYFIIFFRLILMFQRMSFNDSETFRLQTQTVAFP